MSRFKDYFSDGSRAYSHFRPGYPEELFSTLSALCLHHQTAWDCATGSGQAAMHLSRHFGKVIATDASESQLQNAATGHNISYHLATAERSGIRSDSMDLITVAQAFHWFDRKKFALEADRVLKNDGILSIWTYKLLSISDPVDEIIRHLYEDILGACWAPERRMVENGYQEVGMPFEECPAPALHMSTTWNLDQVLGYLQTWSAVKKYQQETGSNPVAFLQDDLEQAWRERPDRELPVRWPLSIRIWRK